MAVPLQLMRFYRTGATVDGGSALDPNASLGGFRAGQAMNILSSITATMTQLGTLIDSTQIDNTPAGPVDQRSILVNSGSYTNAANLLHWYRFGYDSFDITTDYGLGTKIKLDTIRGGLAGTDIDNGVQPGQFDQQRNSLHFNSAGAADNDALVSDPAGQTWGFSNAWSIGIWFRTTTIAAGTSVAYHLKTATGAGNGPSGIRMQRSGGDLNVAVVDNGGTNQKNYTWSGFFAANTWYHVVLTWSGTSLLLYKDGTLLAPDVMSLDQSVTQVDTGTRRLIVGGGSNGSVDPGSEWFGQIHSIGMWNVVLPAAAITQISDFGDGVGPLPLNHVGDWFVFVTGTNALQARRVSFHNNATGEMRFDLPFTGLATSGDFYRIGRALDLWNDGPTPQECASGLVDYRLIGFRNETGEQLINLRIYLQPLDPGTISYEIAVSEDQPSTGFPTIANDLVQPDVKTVGNSNFSNNVQSFRAPRSFFAANETPAAVGDVNLSNNGTYGIWIRRTMGALTRRGRSAWLLIAEAASGSTSGAGPWRSAAVLLSEPLGFTPSFDLQFDRTPRTFGGARLIARLLDSITGVPVEGVPVFIEMVSGPGTIQSPSVQPIETDANGEVEVQYHASNNEGDVGATVVAEARFTDEVAL